MLVEDPAILDHFFLARITTMITTKTISPPIRIQFIKDKPLLVWIGTHVFPLCTVPDPHVNCGTHWPVVESHTSFGDVQVFDPTALLTQPSAFASVFHKLSHQLLPEEVLSMISSPQEALRWLIDDIYRQS
jgi:hypothetical protein